MAKIDVKFMTRNASKTPIGTTYNMKKKNTKKSAKKK